MSVGLVWAQARGGVIGAEGGIPWHVPEDLAHFKAVTLKHPVIMGRKTWDSLPERFRPLPGRRNIVVTRQADWAAEGAERAGSLEEALTLAGTGTGTGTSADATPNSGAEAGAAWVMGGGELYLEAIALADRLEVTEIDLDVAGDAHAPDWSGEEWSVDAREPSEGWLTSRTGIRYRYLSLSR
ncbi:dihydrofolate reductase [Pseudoclavibacter sp. VKM Ac-2867]|uniref:dihydrofolate reductase n=1 Tax=Pseudoclavibacter sp. VKM Ac-2867 TaxID=2783829 RepID=UPI00188B94ED|nr:dihydrofolate reductase [Pseudoclavibacter sp. VKM Ac-2867]MBF4457270.1 dihydrofolate reductase [Pseudoclavibacter sp. VKM Ac-2867]